MRGKRSSTPAQDSAWHLLPILLNAALLLHTAGELQERMDRRREHRAQR